MSQPAIIAVKEERARIGNLHVTKETALMATEEGVIAVERHRIEQQQPQSSLPAPRQVLALQPPPQVVYPEYSWYDPRGKGCCVAFLLFLMWIIIAVVTLPLFVLCCICHLIFGKKDDD